jgi:hypothetical protein
MTSSVFPIEYVAEPLRGLANVLGVVACVLHIGGKMNTAAREGRRNHVNSCFILWENLLLPRSPLSMLPSALSRSYAAR